MNNITNQPGVYQWRNLINNKIYVGSAFDLYKRRREHYKSLVMNYHYNEKFQNSFNFHGEENFVFEILELVPRFENESKLDFKKRLVKGKEQHYLDTLLFAQENDNRFHELGYNIRRIADSGLGTKRTLETREKMSKAMKGKRLGTKRSQESIEKVRLANTGKKRSKEVCEKLSKAMKGVKKSEQGRLNIKAGNWIRGGPGTMKVKKHTPKTIEKLKNIIPTPEAIEARRLGNERKRGRKASEETKAKQKASLKIASNTPEHKALMRKILSERPIIICPHCNYQNKNKGNMTKCHFDRCKQGPDFDYKAEKIRKELLSIKLKEAATRKEVKTCPHCNLSCKNAATMKHHHFDNCKKKIKQAA